MYISRAGKLKDFENVVFILIIYFIFNRILEIPHTYKEICAVSGCSDDEIKKVSNDVCQALNITLPIITPKDYTSRFCSNLGKPYMVIPLKSVVF